MKKILPILKKVAMGIGIASFLFILYALFIAEDPTEMVQKNEQTIADSEKKNNPLNFDGVANNDVSVNNSIENKKIKKILTDKMIEGVVGVGDIERRSDSTIEIINGRNAGVNRLIILNKSYLNKNSWADYNNFISNYIDLLEREVAYSKEVINNLNKIKEAPQKYKDIIGKEFDYIMPLNYINKTEFENESKNLDVILVNIGKVKSQQAKIISDFVDTTDKWDSSHKVFLTQLDEVGEYLYVNSFPTQYTFTYPKVIAPPTILPLNITTNCSFSMNPVGGGGHIYCSSY